MDRQSLRHIPYQRAPLPLVLFVSRRCKTVCGALPVRMFERTIFGFGLPVASVDAIAIFAITREFVMAAILGRTFDEALLPVRCFGGNTPAFARFFGRDVPCVLLCTVKVARKRLPKRLADHLN
jgi:hypothetical protein